MASEITRISHRILDQRQSPTGECLGRDRDLQRLEGLIAPLNRSNGAFAMVTGPAGIGKTRLLQQFARSAGLADKLVVDVRLEPYAPRPYEIWRRTWNGLAARGASLPASMSGAYRAALGRLACGHAETAELPHLPAEQARYRLYDAVRQLLAVAAGSKPVVLLIDDLQHADEPSLKLLRHLLAFLGQQPILIVAACDDAEPSWTALSRLHGAIPAAVCTEHLVLGGLAPAAVQELLAHVGSAGSQEEWSREIAKLTRGSPLHILLLARLFGTDATPTGGALRDLRPVATSAGRTFAHLIASALPASDRDILAVAAHFPDSFTVEDVAYLADVSAVEVETGLANACSLGVLDSLGLPVRHYAFTHPLFRRIILESIDLPARVGLLCRLANSPEGTGGTACDRWERAELYYAVRVLPEAGDGVVHLQWAAEQARALSSPELTARYLAEACEVAQASGHLEADLHLDHALAAADVGAFEESVRQAWLAVELLAGRSEQLSARLDRLVRVAVHLHDAGADPQVWGPFRDQALATMGKERKLAWARLQLLEGGRMQQISGPPLQVGRWLGLDGEAVQISRTAGDETDWCRTLFVYDWHSVADIDDLLERSAHWTATANVARALSVAAETLMYRHGKFERACELLEQQRAMHEQTGSIVEQAKSLVRLTMAQLAAGRLDAAISTRGRARDMVDRLGPGYLIYEHAGTTRGGDLYPEISMESNFAWYIEGDWLAVAEHWAHAVSLEEPGGSPVHIVEAAMAAQAYARLHRFDDARRFLDELTLVLKRLEPRDWAFNGAVGRASHAIWDMAALQYAGDYRDFALGLLANGVGDWTNTSLELTVARMAALLGQDEEACAYFDAARAKLGDKDGDPRRAIVDFDEAVALRLSGATDTTRRESLLQSALSRFEALAMSGWARRASEERLRS